MQSIATSPPATMVSATSGTSLIAHFGRIGEQQREGGGEHRGGLGRALLPFCQTHRTPQGDIVGLRQPRIDQAVGFAGAMREQRGNPRQSRVVAGASLAGIVGRCHVQHGTGLGAKTKRDHGARQGLSPRAAGERRCRGSFGRLLPHSRLSRTERLVGKVELHGQASRGSELVAILGGW